MGYLRKAFETGEWWRLRPVQEILVNQPGDKDIQHFIAVSATESREFAVVYIPVSMEFSLNLREFPSNLKGMWFDPRTGLKMTPFEIQDKDEEKFTPPGEGDWILILKTQ